MDQPEPGGRRLTVYMSQMTDVVHQWEEPPPKFTLSPILC